MGVGQIKKGAAKGASKGAAEGASKGASKGAAIRGYQKGGAVERLSSKAKGISVNIVSSFPSREAGLINDDFVIKCQKHSLTYKPFAT